MVKSIYRVENLWHSLKGDDPFIRKQQFLAIITKVKNLRDFSFLVLA